MELPPGGLRRPIGFRTALRVARRFVLRARLSALLGPFGRGQHAAVLLAGESGLGRQRLGGMMRW